MAKQRRRRRRGRRKKGNWFTRLSMGKRIAVCVGGLMLCLVATGAIFVAAKLQKVDNEDIPDEDIVVNKEAEKVGVGYTTVALFGIDSRDGELELGTRSDCIIVASLNNETKEVRMVSVYRDTVLDIGEGELQKCNAAYSFGGPKQAINMLNKNLDLNIQDYATVDFAAIANAIDLLGGVEIDVREEEIQYLNKYVRETARVAKKEAHEVTKAGKQNLDGVQATTYARIRSTAGGDFTRTERQRLVIEKIAEKAQKSDLATLNNMVDELLPTIKTSFSATEILGYAADAMKYKIGDTAGFPFDKTTDTISGLGSIVIPVNLDNNVEKMHEFLYDGEEYEQSVEVKNISDMIIARIGQREAMDESTLTTQTYQVAPEDQAQESNDYGTGLPDNSGGNTDWNQPSAGDTDTGGGDTGGGNAGGGNVGGGNTGGGGGDTGGGNTGGGGGDIGGGNADGGGGDAGAGAGDTGGGNADGGGGDAGAGAGDTGGGDAGVAE